MGIYGIGRVDKYEKEPSEQSEWREMHFKEIATGRAKDVCRLRRLRRGRLKSNELRNFGINPYQEGII